MVIGIHAVVKIALISLSEMGAISFMGFNLSRKHSFGNRQPPAMRVVVIFHCGRKRRCGRSARYGLSAAASRF